MTMAPARRIPTTQSADAEKLHSCILARMAH
jgi:hypothetical protein